VRGVWRYRGEGVPMPVVHKIGLAVGGRSLGARFCFYRVKT
jgi:hypothetical protein